MTTNLSEKPKTNKISCLEQKTIFSQLVSLGYNRVSEINNIKELPQKVTYLSEQYLNRLIVDFAIIPVIESMNNQQEFRGKYYIYIKEYK